jgi:hypothetical protein
MNNDSLTLFLYGFNGIFLAFTCQLHVNYDNSFTPLHSMKNITLRVLFQ